MPNSDLLVLFDAFNASVIALGQAAERQAEPVRVPWYISYMAATGSTGKVDLGGRLLDAEGISIFGTSVYSLSLSFISFRTNCDS